MANKIRIPKVVSGGIALPLGNNFYYMTGRKHSQGGIDIGQNPKTGLEVESGEVVKMQPKSIKVYSSVPFLNGKSPAEKILGGENPNTVFRQQEQYKDRNGINDDGTKKGNTNKAQMGTITYVNPVFNPFLKQWYRVNNKGERIYLPGNSYPNASDEQLDALSLGSFNRGEQGIKNYIQKNGITSAYNMYKPFIELNKEKKSMGGLSNSKHYKHRQRVSKETQEDISEELDIPRRRYKAGGIYSVTVDGKTRYKMIPSTGKRTKALFGINTYDDRKKKEDDEYVYILPEISITAKRPQKGADKTNIYNSLNTNLYNEEKERLSKQTINANINQLHNNIKPVSVTFPQRENWVKRTKNSIKYNISKDPSIISDIIGLGSNTIGGIASSIINNKMLNRLKYSPQPVPQVARKLKTRININPQLDRMRESLASYEKQIDSNTGSSQVALARKQRARFANSLQTNVLYGEKENQETELINKDRLNQQSITNSNIAAYNQWAENKRNFENSVAEKKAENKVALIETLNSGVQDLIGRREKRNNERQTITAMSLANPDLPIEVFYEQGLISKKTYEAYKKAYRNRKEK